MANLLGKTINSDDGGRAARIIQDALGVESGDVANYCFPKTRRPIANSSPPECLQIEARF